MPYLIPRKHVVELNGDTLKFHSVHRSDRGIKGDAIQACKDAGIYHSFKDAHRMLIDGRKIELY